jgi:hypothetical protein
MLVLLGLMSSLAIAPPNPAASAAKTTNCNVSVFGVPESRLATIVFKLDGHAVDFPTLSSDLQITIDAPHGLSAESETLIGSATLTQEVCATGVQLELEPKRARIRFAGAVQNTVVRCLEGCPVRHFALHDDFPPFSVEVSTGQRVVFEYKAVGYETGRASWVLLPGTNLVKINPQRPLDGPTPTGE